MLAIERRQKIMEEITREGKVYVSALSQLFHVTEETIRRDLEKLEGQDLLRRSYGGAILNDHTGEDLSFQRRSSINSESKEAIAKKAMELVKDGDTIMMDSSTTCLALLHQLSSRKDLTIITNSIRLVYDFVTSPFHLISTGGNLRPNSYALTGPVAIATLQKYFVDIAVFSCKGVTLERDVMESNEEESVVKQWMIKQARKSILLADHSKFNRTAFIKTCDFEDITALVTDEMPNEEWQERLAGCQVNLIA